MKIRKALAIILAILLVGWMALIFAFSCEDGKQSGQTSTEIATDISEIVMPSKPVEETEKIIEENHKTIRKSAHFLVYMVLGVLSVAFLSASFDIQQSNKLILSISFCLFYAATDEIHQYFVAGRSGMAEDICLDFVSAFVGISAFLIFEKIVKNLWNKKRRIS